MHKSIAALTAVVIAGTSAVAQPTVFEAAPGYLFTEHTSQIAATPDGTSAMLLVSADPAEQKASRVELVRLDRDGRMLSRRLVMEGPAKPYGLRYNTRLAPLRSGEMILALSSELDADSRPTSLGGILRLSPTGEVLNRARLPFPNYASAEMRKTHVLEIATAMATADNGVVLGGGYGPGPSTWWMAKFSANGVRLAEDGARKVRIPAAVDAIAPLPGGGWQAIARDLTADEQTTDVVLLRYDATGKRQSRRVLVDRSESHLATFTPQGRVMVVKADTSRLLLFDHGATSSREIAWAGPRPRKIVADDEGFLALFDKRQGETEGRIVRLDREGSVRWQSPPGNYIDLISVGGEPRALALDGEGGSATYIDLKSR
ncbi:MAG: hypothetical protein NTV97_33305 [Alphaproteobacteria bacterium]|nr:hypothetical protein [Alphaproteobacteria bacterium]